MTGFPKMDKKPSLTGLEEATGEECAANKRSHKTLFLKVIIVFLLMVVVCASGIVITLKVASNSSKNVEWVIWTRQTGDITIKESVLIDEEEQTIMMISAESYKIKEDNSLALHDFSNGKVAIRDFRAGECFVTDIQTPDFTEARAMLEERKGKVLPLQTLAHADVRSENMTSEELGPKLTLFCQGVPAKWFDIRPEHDVESRAARATWKPPIHTSCIYRRINLVCRPPKLIQLSKKLK